MKILSMHTRAYDKSFTTINEIFKANITELMGPELHLEDNSVLILPDMTAYYDLTNLPVYHSTEEGAEIDIDEYESIYSVLEDDVENVIYENENVNYAKQLGNIPDNNKFAYRLFKED